MNLPETGTRDPPVDATDEPPVPAEAKIRPSVSAAVRHRAPGVVVFSAPQRRRSYPSMPATSSSRRGLSAAIVAIALAACLGVPAVAGAQQHDVAVAAPPGASGEDAKFRFLFDPIAAWPATVLWNYNASGAPALFSNASTVTSQMQQVIATWTSVCNIHAAYAGPTSFAPENTVGDGENGPQPDLVNVLGWKSTPAGISGYTVGYPGFSDGGGFAPIVDADIVIDPVKVTTSDFFSRLLLHEFGHLLGINHSQLNGTLMSGPPYSDYNAVGTLTLDDARACQCLYGPPPGVSAGTLCSTPPVLEFGSQPTGSSSQKTFQVGNSGNASVTIASVSATPGAYQTSGCGAGTTVGPGASCTMQVTFAPATAGDQSGFVTIETGESSPYRIKLVGASTGSPQATLASNPGSVEFGLIPIQTSASTQRIKLNNKGASSLTLGTLQFQGAQANEFSRSGVCNPGVVIEAGGNCTADIGFRPAATGSRGTQLFISTTDGRSISVPLKGTGDAPLPSKEPVVAQPGTVVEFYREESDHYFMTMAPDEVAALDSGLFPGWVRTGRTFKAHSVSQPGYAPICRFYLPHPADSHFYASNPECSQVAAYYTWFILESTSVMHLALPNPISGACPAGTVPIYRVWNRRPDTNHRYMTDVALRDEMVAKGYIAEGSGPNHVMFCGPA
jgi:hypothetical protein